MTLFAAVPRPGPLANHLRSAGVQVVFCDALARMRRRVSLAQLIKYVRACKQLRDITRQHSISLIHANSVQAALYALNAKVPFVWHVRDLRFGTEAMAIARKAGGAIAPSESCARALARKVRHARVNVVRNGVDIDRFASVRRVDSGEEAFPLAVAIGHLVPWKRYDLLLEAVNIVRGAGVPLRVKVLGGAPFDGGPGELAAWRRRAAGGGSVGAVEFVGEVTDVTVWLARADLLIHTAYPEPFGRVLIEAMAAGVPVVAFAGAHGPAEILRGGDGGWLVEERTADGLARVLERVLRNQSLLRQSGERARQHVVHRYRRCDMSARVADFYGEVMAPVQRLGHV